MTPLVRPRRNAPVWIDQWVDTTERHYALRAFLSAVFDWSWDVEGADRGYYSLARHDGSPVMGLGVNSHAPGPMTTYFSTDRIDPSLARATQLGALVRAPVVTVRDLGTAATLEDPFGVTFGLWQPATFTGFGDSFDVGTPGWFEHVSARPDAAGAFYEHLTGHGATTASEELHALHDDGQWFANFSPLDDDGPRWAPIFIVNSLQRVRDVVPRLGGAVVSASRDVAGSAWCTFREPVNATVITVMADANDGAVDKS